MRGFTLIEMLVVLAIMVIITAIALVGQSSFNRSLTLTDTAYTVALSIRESQSLGLSTRRFVRAASGSQSAVDVQGAGYGVHFTVGNTYVQFVDSYPAEGTNLGALEDICPGHTETSGPEARSGNCLYDVNQDVAMKTYRFERGFRIARFCGKNTIGAEYCSTGGSALTAITIVFLRPNTESVIIGRQGAGTIELASAEIVIEPADGGASRYICVSKVGQVAVSGEECS